MGLYKFLKYLFNYIYEVYNGYAKRSFEEVPFEQSEPADWIVGLVLYRLRERTDASACTSG
jgi:hypothetical protein